MSDFPKSMRQRFIRRSWRGTSDKICQVNDFPPGFRIVLLDEDGRVKRDDLLVRSGQFTAYSAGFPVSAFLDEIMKNHVKDADRLNYDSTELRTHQDRRVNPTTTLRRVRDMSGSDDTHSEAFKHSQDIVHELGYEVENALAIFDEDPRLASDPELLLRALVQYVIDRFEIDALECTLDHYKNDIEHARRERG